jgi:hypothetical protein
VEDLNDVQRFAKLKLESFAALKVDQQIAQICVWAVHHDMIEQGRMLCDAQRVALSEDQMHEVAFFFLKVWQLDLGRDERTHCFLCKAQLPELFERLCKCFRAAQVARYIDPITPQTIMYLRKQYPEDWNTLIVETIQCQNAECGCLAPVTAGVVNARFQKGRTWRSPKLCMECFTLKNKSHGQRTRPPRSAPKAASSLKALQVHVATVSPPTAET